MIRLLLFAFSLASSSLVPNFGAGARLGDNFAAKCVACETGVKPLLPFVRSERGAAAFIWTLKRICWRFRIFDKNICFGTIELFKPEFLAVVRRVRPSPKSVCNLLFPDCFSNAQIWALFNWKNIEIPARKTPRKKVEFPAAPEATLKVLQLTDVHIDLEYAENAVSQCDQPLCCRATSTSSNSRKEESGKTAFFWGTKASCDIPFRTFEATLDAAAEIEPEPDFILWTGDVPAHNLWEYSPRATSGLLFNVTAEIRARFPNTPVFPSVGNHEGVPVNAFPASSYWLYETLACVWEPFGLEAQSLETVKKHGYYSQLIRPGFRVLSINSNFCNDENFWILLTDGDPGNQHQWLVDTLSGAEAASEKVLLVGHIPPGEPDTITSCSAEFYKIIDRFSETVTAQFFGHTHWDQLKLFYDEQRQATSVAYVGPSVTTWEGVDPAFRIYEIDSWQRANSTFAVLDFHTFKTNVEETPRTAFPKFFKSYSALSEYELRDLSPDSWARLVSRWENNKDERGFQKYFSNYYHKTGRNKCVGECRAKYICEIQAAKNKDPVSSFCQNS